MTSNFFANVRRSSDIYIIRIEVDWQYSNNMLKRNCLKTVLQPEFSFSRCHFSLPISRAINY